MLPTAPPDRVRRAPSLVRRLILGLALVGALLPTGAPAFSQSTDPVEADGDLRPFRPADVFELEWASDPRISPDGAQVVYVRNRMDVMTDRRRSELWMVDATGGGHRPLVTSGDPAAPRWSPAGDRLLYVARAADEEEGAELHLHWLGSGRSAAVTHLPESPSSPAWSPDGTRIAFTMRVPEREQPFAPMPEKPEGAEWAPAPKVIDHLIYRADGAGYVEEGFTQVFVVPAEGGTPRQVTSGPYDHDGTPAWTPDGEALIVAANRHEDWRHRPLDSELYEVRLDGETGAPPIRALTDRDGPDYAPALSPDGRRIAYLGFDDRLQGYQVAHLWLVDRQGGAPRRLATGLDRDVVGPVWSADGERLLFQYDDQGVTKLAAVPAAGGPVEVLAENVGGLSLGRPYAGGSFTAAARPEVDGGGGLIAFTLSGPHHPADVAVVEAGGRVERLTRLNRDLLGQRDLGAVEEIRFPSSHDGREIQGWVVKPPGFDPGGTYPLLLEIHGGPFANYGPRFAAEIQLYAAAGYVVLYVNPRGSTSYGEAFGNLIHHAYPGDDYSDLMSGVDAVLGRGWVDPERLYVTGGSGGGVLSAWIVGKTDRFRAAAVQKPVINWTSFALTADGYNFFHQYWFPAPPWEQPEEYWRRSPLSLVGNVSTPTMVITGEEDYRTPISESEQLYQALQIRKVDSALVRIPGASHGIARHPSHLVAKVAHVLAWFARHGGPEPPGAERMGR